MKGGTAPIMDVIGYGDAVVTKGLNMLYGPGNDLVSATAMTAAGAHLILFTTGRGTPFGTFVPTMKVSTNNQLAEKKSNWIDFNAGALLETEKPDKVLAELVEKVIATADGGKLHHEKIGAKEIAIFKTGVTL